ncbi:hypothetical protein MNBD_ALPHA06-2137 [hydrothermal vent metagenome]|uniref:peptidylprolyl isomerase n=1 Tax=hydrothermal vent metagenome TaxID=652676 RepID=A0A3B0RRP0_9ZZZZ
MQAENWRRVVLLLGVVAGLGLAAVNALGGGGASKQPLAAGAIARVNTVSILNADLIRALQAVSQGRHSPLSQADETEILNRLIEEELLVQRALALGLAQEDPALRSALVSAMTSDILSRNLGKPVSPVRLRDFYFQNKASFAVPGRVFIRAIFIPTAKAESQIPLVEQALLDGIDPKTLAEQFGSDTPPVPAGLLPVQKLLDYVGPQVVTVIPSAPIGQWSNWIKTNAGSWRIIVVQKTNSQVLPFEDVAEQVRAAYQVQRDDAALRKYLDQLLQNANIQYRDEPSK